jgi:hypothetical protein
MQTALKMQVKQGVSVMGTGEKKKGALTFSVK